MTNTFDDRTAQELGRMVYQLKNEVAALRQSAAHQSSGLGIEYVKCQTTLYPGQSATATMLTFDRNTNAYQESNRYTSLTVYDPHNWAFAVGMADFATTDDVLPVYANPQSGRLEVIAPTGLIRQAKPDATISSGATGTFSVYQEQTDTTVNLTGVNVIWGDNGDGVTSGQESWVRWNGAAWEWFNGDNTLNAGVGKGTLTTAMTSSNTTIGVALDSNSAVGSGTITANNFCGFEGDNGAKCYVATDGTTWELIQVACPASSGGGDGGSGDPDGGTP